MSFIISIPWGHLGKHSPQATHASPLMFGHVSFLYHPKSCLSVKSHGGVIDRNTSGMATPFGQGTVPAGPLQGTRHFFSEKRGRRVKGNFSSIPGIRVGFVGYSDVFFNLFHRSHSESTVCSGRSNTNRRGPLDGEITK